jgi:flagellar biosynthesis/type III secretory pathway protein FliH
MKLFNLKSLVGVAALGLALVAGVSDANAQDWGRTDRDYRQADRREEKLERQRIKLERERLRLERQRMQMANRYRVYRDGRWYNTDSRGADLLRQAVRDGYRQGFAAGRADRNRRIGRMDWGGSSMYRSGTYGWQSHVDRSQYQHYFRQGFERGYRDGYNSRNQYGSYNNGSVNILGSILGSILNIQRY